MEIPTKIIPAWFDAAEVLQVQATPGGLSSSRVWKIVTSSGSFSLKAWPCATWSSERLSTIHQHIQLLNDRPLNFIPRIQRSRFGQSLLESQGWLWEAMTWVDGKADLSGQVKVERRRAVAQAVAAVHQCWSRQAIQRQVAPGIIDRIHRLQKFQKLSPQLRRHATLSSQPTAQGNSVLSQPNTDDTLPFTLDRFTRDSSGQPADLHELTQRTIAHLSGGSADLLSRLERLCQPVELHFVMRDLHSEHVLYTADHVTGMIDFGAARVDEPLLDLVRLLASQSPLERDARYQTLEFYCQARSEMALSAIEQDREVLFRRFAVLDHVSTLLSALQWMEWLVIQRMRFPVPEEQLKHRWQNLLDRLDQACW